MLALALHDRDRHTRSLGLEPPRDLARQGHLWMLRQDLAGFIALGDPAVKLPLAPEQLRAAAVAREPERTQQQAEIPEDLVAFGVTAAPAKASTEHALDDLEDAIAHVILGDIGARKLAEGLGRSQKDLERLAKLYREAGRLALKKHLP